MLGVEADHCGLFSLTINPKGVDWLLPTPSVEGLATPSCVIAFAGVSEHFSTKFNRPFDQEHT